MVWESIAGRGQVRARQPHRDRRPQRTPAVRLAAGVEPDARGDRRDPWAGSRLREAFEAFGWRVLEIDGHDFDAIVAACADARAAARGPQPTAILAETVKGRGLSFTEGRFEWHARVATADEAAAARLELGPTDGAGRVTRPLRDVWAETLIELAADNPDLLVLDGDLATSTRADRFADAHPDRFLQMGIAEQNMVGVAAGLATLGYVPWLSSFAVFMTHRAVDQVRMLVAQTHANVKIGAGYAGLLTGFTGKTHQDVEDLAIMRAMPGMTVLAPADPTECAAMVRWATETPGPVYLRLARDAGPDVFEPGYRFEPGRVIRLREGSDVLMVSTGLQTARCLDAAAILETAGDLRRRAPRPVAQTGRRGGDRRCGAARSTSSSASRSTRSSAASAASSPRSSASASPAASSGSGSRTPGASRRRTPSCSTATGCRPSGSRSGSPWRSPMPRTVRWHGSLSRPIARIQENA